MMHGGDVWQGGKPSDWLDFSANLRPEGMPDWVKAAMRRAAEEARYYPDAAMKAAKQGLAAYAGVSEDRILPVAGGIAAIDLMLSMGRGTVFIDQPAFGEYAARAAAHGRKCAAAKDACCQSGDTRVICNPENPDGAALEPEEILKVHKAVAQRGAELLVDEAFIDYCPELSVRGDVRSGLTVVGSLTKILCIPGVRLGYVCASEESISRLRERALPWQLNAFAARIAAELPEHLDEIRKDALLNAYRRDGFTDMLRNMGVKVTPSRANFLLCDFERDMSEAVETLKSKRILVRPCVSFGLGTNFLRLAVRTEEENRMLTEELKRCLKS